MKTHEGPHRSQRNRGTAFMAALMMFVLIGCAVTSLMILFATQARRTRAAIVGPQLRQLLMAGAAIAANDLQQHGVEPRELSVHPPLEGGSIAIQITRSEGSTATARLVAAIRDQRAVQTVEFLRDRNARWSVASAELRD